ncbi:hypothetical protein BZG35_08320 [Brevundimonas sp. LM2]|uniref:LacI family DNA-binding transcriptional regulator n=1 Tax=Brevundimonas sp. LM2 TaxID=1938605 RepID=UPI000983B486|nr:LacI family DNA-binding transcriptional regulator [Brevundimonas sp. LM2]AQR61654.1 hypothetical protein BZG35_08320 [Brevundimonas sp. LM2]
MTAARSTIKDVALRAGVSVATVSRFLTGANRVKPATRLRVEHAIAELAYVPDPAGRALSLHRARAADKTGPAPSNPKDEP